jgi:parallel beta-helix repeat protein
LSVKSIRFGAKGDGRTDDTAAIQEAVKAVAGTGGTLTIPPGTYLINPVANLRAGIRLGSDMTLDLEPGAVLQALPTSVSDYSILLASGVRNVTIRGGTLIGNRNNNTITDPYEAGFGVELANCQHVVVEGTQLKDFWADGCYVTNHAKDITLCNIVATGNRRNGLSVVSVDGMVVRGCTFSHSTGSIEDGAFANGSGIDLEPNLGETVANVQITGCLVSSNPSVGIAVGPAVVHRGKAFTPNILIEANTVIGNGFQSGASGIEISNTEGHRILNNILKDNVGIGILLRSGANNNLVSGNRVTGTRAGSRPRGSGGIVLEETGGNTVSGNSVTNSEGYGIRDAAPTGTNVIRSNQVEGNHPNFFHLLIDFVRARLVARS